MTEEQTVEKELEIALTPEQALQNLATASAQFKGTKDEHLAIAQSVEIIWRILKEHVKAPSDEKV